MISYFGGSFAPPLSDATLLGYELIASNAKTDIRKAMRECLLCVRKWWDLPESSAEPRPHPIGVGSVIALDYDIPNLPPTFRLDQMQTLFLAIPQEQRELRNAALHLLWHLRYLDAKIEPITADKV